MRLAPKGTSRLFDKTKLAVPKEQITQLSVNQHARQQSGPKGEAFATNEVLAKYVLDNQGSVFDLTSQSTSFSVNVSGRPSVAAKFRNISVTHNGSIRLKHITAQKVALAQRDVLLEDATIYHLEIDGYFHEAVIKDCVIGTLELKNGNRIEGDLELENCTILCLRFPKEISLRDIRLKNCTFVDSYEKPLEKDEDIKLIHPRPDRASFGFLHDWAVKAGNSEIAHMARGKELAIEQRTATSIFERLVLSLWGGFGNFGLSPLRPILWMIAAMVAMCGILFFTGTSLGLSEDQVAGWRVYLMDSKTHSGALTRAISGALEGSISPLSIFSPRRMIIPDETIVAGLQVVYGYFCLTMVLLFGFSVRRRFKIG